MHRTYHLSRIPQLNRKVRVVVDWTLALFLKREVVSLGELHDPREPFTDVTPPIPAPDASRTAAAGLRGVTLQIQVSSTGCAGAEQLLQGGPAAPPRSGTWASTTQSAPQ